MIVVLPCYDEPDVMLTVESLYRCRRGDFKVEIIVLVNSYSIDTEATVAANRLAFEEISRFAAGHNTGDFFFSPVWADNLPGRQSGAGMPRKLGMDEAVRRFGGRKSGVIVSLDADCQVEENYLVEIYRHFQEYHLHSATIAFHHPVDRLAADDPLRRAAGQYEKYLRYYRSALEYCGYPYAFFTVGSAFAVTVEAYVKVGGMGKQQSGEDFYFLQKVFPLGRTRYIDTTCVYPAARLSRRVPFGTGTELQKMLRASVPVKMTYRFTAFESLKILFDGVDGFFRQPAGMVETDIRRLPEYLRRFLEADGFVEKLVEINKHTASSDSFRKRFFNYFNAFKIIKYLNFVHPGYMSLGDVDTQDGLLRLAQGVPTLRREGSFHAVAGDKDRSV